MMHNNHKKSGCGFDELLVSYLYGETNAAETAKFAAHLETCAGCADELEAFAGVMYIALVVSRLIGLSVVRRGRGG